MFGAIGKFIGGKKVTTYLKVNNQTSQRVCVEVPGGDDHDWYEPHMPKKNFRSVTIHAHSSATEREDINATASGNMVTMYIEFKNGKTTSVRFDQGKASEDKGHLQVLENVVHGVGPVVGLVGGAAIGGGVAAVGVAAGPMIGGGAGVAGGAAIDVGCGQKPGFGAVVGGVGGAVAGGVVGGVAMVPAVAVGAVAGAVVGVVEGRDIGHDLLHAARYTPDERLSSQVSSVRIVCHVIGERTMEVLLTEV